MEEILKPIHINAEIGDIAEVVLFPGDPLRAKYIAENFLENAREVTNLRNMLGFTGTYKGKEITVMGHGMGIPSISIYAYELFRFYNVKKIIRIGTCGAVSESVNIFDLVLANNSYAFSNFSLYFGEEEHIAKPSVNLNEIIKNKAQELKYKLFVGDIVTVDFFTRYVNTDNLYESIPNNLNIVAEEMESFALFYLANFFNREAACLLTIVDSKFTSKIVSSEDREKSLNEMIILALESIIVD